MSTSEEELDRRKKQLYKYVIASNQEFDKKLQALDNLSAATGNIFDALHKLGKMKEKEMLDYRLRYQKFFLEQLNPRKDYRSQLDFVSEQIKDLRLKIADAKANRHEHYQKIYEDTLHDVVLPFKTDLIEMIRLENEVGKLRQETASQAVIEVHQSVEAIPVKKAVEEMGKIPTLEIIHDVILKKKDALEYKEEKKELDEIVIPVTIEEKPLTTKTGKSLNNLGYISNGRKFNFKDERIPDLIGDFLLEQGCIFDYQLKIVQNFFRTSKCDRKIIFDGNANQLTTILYDLKGEKYTTIFNDHLGKLIEAFFVKKENTMQALISRKSLVADLKRGNVSRRTKPGSSHHLDIVSYLREKLKTPE